VSLLSDIRAATSAAWARRESAGRALEDEAPLVARACHDMAQRFHRGGKLIVFGDGASATDAAHVAVEFVHPVIVGKRALPAMALTNDPATVTGVANTDGFAEVFVHQLRCFADAPDIALGISPDGNCANVRRALAAAHDLGLLTVALTGGDGGAIAREGATDHVLVARADDPVVVKEVHVTMYHLLWELVHVFFERVVA
jgi:D-sedoheptulose 7-phosphate isomerase